MTTFCNSPESVSSSRRESSTSVLVPTSNSSLGNEHESRPSSTRSVSPAVRYGSPRLDQDIPYFTVARYQNPTAPVTYELPAVPQFASNSEFQESLPSIADTDFTSPTGAGEAFYNGSLDLSPMSPMELAFGKVSDNNSSNGEWLGKSFDIPHTPGSTVREIKSPREEPGGLFRITSPVTSTFTVNFVQDRTPGGCIHEASGDLSRLAGESSQVNKITAVPPKAKKHDEIPVRGCVNFVIDSSPRKPPITKPKPYPKPIDKLPPKRRVSVPANGAEGRQQNHRNSFGEEVVRSGSSLVGSINGTISDNQLKNLVKRTSSDRKSEVYEDASVTDAAEKLENSRPSSSNDHTPRTPRTPRSKSREPSFCLELRDDNYPKTDAEYVALLQKKIAEAHERQLLPLKEDLADWLNKLLGEEDLTPDNLISNLNNGVIMCRLATLISTKAQDARDKELSTLEVPRLPYRIWGRARSGTFFARDNISNFIRFCKRLGVHTNLLFETEDLVCGTGVRSVVLCLLEVGRLAQLWWGLEPPGIVKLERELDGEELSGRSDSGFSNTSSPRESTLALHTTTAPTSGKPPRPLSAPSQLPVVTKLGCAAGSNQIHSQDELSSVTRLKSSTPRGSKPSLPPKPASIKRAVDNITKRPNSFPTSRSYDRGWSGAKTTPTTPVTTPTHTSRTRLPVAKTPHSSGRSTPNTTPTTPTQCRRYLVSMQRTPPGSTSRPPTGSTTPGRTPTKIPIRTPTPCNRLQDALVSPNPDDEAKIIQSDLDCKVQDIVEQTHGMCGCRNTKCTKPHIKRLSDGKYDVLGKNVLIRLLKGKHVMVRVGGGWDTLEHYLLRHDPTQVKMYKAKSNSDSPFLHCRSRYRSPTPSEKSSKGSSRDASFSDSLKKNGDGSPSRLSSPTASERSLIDDSHHTLECLEETSPNDPPIDGAPRESLSDQRVGPRVSSPINQNMGMDEITSAFRSLEDKMKNSSQSLKKHASNVNDELEPSSFQEHSCEHHNHRGSCHLLSAPVGQDGDFQHLPTAMSSTSLHSMLVVSCPTLDLAESVSDLTNISRVGGDCRSQQESDAEASANEDSTQAGSDDEKQDVGIYF